MGRNSSLKSYLAIHAKSRDGGTGIGQVSADWGIQTNQKNYPRCDAGNPLEIGKERDRKGWMGRKIGEKNKKQNKNERNRRAKRVCAGGLEVRVEGRCDDDYPRSYVLYVCIIVCTVPG